ncbi:MAG: GWxTD domain-containing protein [Candidatus Aminicenantes bacterium]|nr:GWxTD domain-containing protein [Candidatus Aminicenantes bacterium]
MRHPKTVILFCCVCLFLSSVLFAQSEKKSPKDLPEVFKKWLEEEVPYIITASEKDVFLRLDSDRDRTRFIEAFWKQRDPTPGTPDNEFKTEHYRRIVYANQKFRPGGWRSDMGRVHIILGPPLTVQRFTSYTKIYPLEIWSYQQEPRAGLPPNFNLVFFDRRGAGDFVLYSPRNDGPQSLLIGYEGHPQDYKQAYDILNEYSTILAMASISLIPGEDTVPSMPSMTSDLLLQQIDRVPRLEVEDLYAENFLRFKDLIEVEYSANYVGSSHLVHVSLDEGGTFLVHYFVGLERLSVNRHEDTYYTVLELNGMVTAPDGKTVYQFDKTYPLEFSEEQFEALKNSALAVYDVFPLVPGEYTFSLLLKNRVSKEFTSFEKKLSVLPLPEKLMITPLLLAYDVKPGGGSTSALIPFQIPEGQLVCTPENIFLKSDTLRVFFQISGLTPALARSGKAVFTFSREGEVFLSASKPLPDSAAGGVHVLADFPLNEFPAADYVLAVAILDGDGRKLVEVEKRFSVTPLAQIARPRIISKITSLAQGALVPYITGMQHLNAGAFEEAVARLETAFYRNPGVVDFALGLGRAYLLTGQNDKVERVLGPFLEGDSVREEVIRQMAEAKKNRGRYEEAAELYRRILSGFGASLDALNDLGFCYYRLGDMKEARAAWSKSLEINPDQPEIKGLLDSLREK